jgi:secondary thiamine-phosphate synthase enzyme
MIRQSFHILSVNTQGRGFYEITHAISEYVRQGNFKCGLVSLLVKHTSASLVIQENADPGVRRDLEKIFSRIAPDGDPIYEHDYEGVDDMAAHARSALTNVNLNIPFSNGELALGTWQGIFLWEHRFQRHCREIAVHILGE